MVVGAVALVLASFLLAGNFNNNDNNNNEDSGRQGPDVLFMVMSASLFIFGVVTADEINVSNDLRNPVVISEEIAEFIKATATAAAEEAAAAVAKEAVSAAASSEKDCCAIM